LVVRRRRPVDPELDETGKLLARRFAGIDCEPPRRQPVAQALCKRAEVARAEERHHLVLAPGLRFAPGHGLGHGLAVGLALGLGFGLAVGLLALGLGLAFGIAVALRAALGFALAFGIAVRLGATLGFGLG